MTSEPHLARLYDSWRGRIDALLDEVRVDLEPVDAAAIASARAIGAGGVVAVFGTGHSHLLAEEGFYRAGGLVPVLPVQIPGLMLHEGAAASTRLERQPGLAEAIYDAHRLEPQDLVIVASNSGRNAVPIEFAMTARRRGNTVVALTSRAASARLAPRHAGMARLFEVADIVLDNHGAVGDAAVEIAPGLPAMGPTSTILGSFLLHLVFMRAAGILADEGREVPVLRSANVDDGTLDDRMLARWRHRIRF